MAQFNRRFGRGEARIVRRGFRRAFGVMPALPPGMIRGMVQAHRLFATGQYAQSASLLENLANTARAGGLPRAPRLFFQAARANWHANQVPHGMDLLQVALDLLVAAGRLGVAAQIASMATTELTGLGHKQEADQVRDIVSKIPGLQEAASEAALEEKVRPVLPTHCAQCGAIVRSDEVDWIDEITAACAYCGSPIRPDKT
jgi:hypothetical protein